MNAVLNNAKAGAIILAKNPGLTILGILSLVLGIGANTSVFNIVNAMTLVPHCAQAPDRLATILTNHSGSAFDRCGEFEVVESQSDSKDEDVGFETSVLTTGAAESDVSFLAGNESTVQAQGALPKNQADGRRCGQSHPGKNDLAAAACGGYVLQLQ